MTPRLAAAWLACAVFLSPHPARAQAPAWRRVGMPALAPEAQLALDALNATAARPFRSEPSPRTQRAAAIWGGSLAAHDVAPELAALDFLRDHAALFALPAGLEAHAHVRGERERRVYVRYASAGTPIEGLDAVVLFDALGDIERVAVRVPELAVESGTFDLDPAAARQAARAALDDYRAQSGRTRSVTWPPPRLTEVFLAGALGLRAAWRAEFSSSDGREAYASYVDAQDGTPLGTLERVAHAGGQYPHFGGFVGFDTTTATGYVYADQADALDEQRSKQDLKSWSKGVGQPAGIAKGFLAGKRVHVWDAEGDDAFAANGKFLYHPLTASAGDFDQTNAYYQIETFYRHLSECFDTSLGASFALPLVVNVADNEPDAFFSAGAFPLGGHVDGFMAFSDLAPFLGTPSADLARDPTIVHHEYTHAWIHFEDEGFEGSLHWPTRAVGEALADFYATTYAKDTLIGRYCAQVLTGAECLRDLQDDDHFPETVEHAQTLSSSGLPEEHRSGEVFASFLTDLRLLIPDDDAQRLVFRALPLMPSSMAELGFPSINAGNALAASGACFDACAWALLETTGSVNNAAAIIGSAAGRGLLGQSPASAPVSVDLEPLTKRKITFPSRFVVASTQTYAFEAKQGRRLDVTIQAKSGSDVRPDFTIGALGSAGPGAVILEHAPKQFSSGGHKVAQEDIELLMPTGTVYWIQVTTAPGALGRFTLTLDA